MTRHFDAKGYDATTDIAPDLMEAARDATRGIIDLLSRRHGMAPVDAYMLDQCRDREADPYVDNIRSAVMGGIGPSPAVLGVNFKDTVEKFLTPSATHNSMTKRHSLQLLLTPRRMALNLNKLTS